ncbi:Putative Acyl transferase domain superfamily, phosphopantetheine binding ACP domain, thiolase [Colletotrichum destructivum]|uniref:Acyl transferase domain superfamily, phosphopantetheine binding ACP domain, thiolase n=1 Tax=Colletotrichum destructivum TaxID=34406 RepID=A0AAX4J4K5_9PEZI|nr:Putative Acyl transferase domain superfamily, phosphopantetheine binding ACP domain, thiolase [Colletotrichum destructivum]
MSSPHTSRDDVSVAITGLSCRFPGDCESPESFWETIRSGKSAWSEVPASRWKGDGYWSANKRRNTCIAKSGHFIKQDISRFDASFFGISSAEAAAMDPQHRLMTEVAFEALEAAGLTLDQIRGSKTGVWVGHFTSDYKEMLYRDPDGAPAYAATGLQKTSLANRLSWLWDLRGPSFTLDTACSSSLVALHVACQSLRLGECDMAIVGGSNLLLGPDVFNFFGGQGFLSPDGKSKSFDASADGYGRGEGFAAVVLKRADDAILHQDPIRAVIRGTACNQDGHTKGFTLPSSEAQIALIKSVYGLAGLNMDETGYVEAHGTGTQAGDLAETLALSQTLASSRSAANRLLVGSVKSNIGHLEAVAGLAAVIKSVLVLEKGMIPPNIHLKTPNPKIPFDDWNLAVPTALTVFPPNKKSHEGLRRISVNSFGYGGTNAHAILDDAASYLSSRAVADGLHFTKTAAGVSRRELPLAAAARAGGKAAANSGRAGEPIRPHSRLYPITSQDRNGLARAKKALSDFLKSSSSSSSWTQEQQQQQQQQQADFLGSVAYTLSEKRSHFQWKTYVVASSSSVAEVVETIGRKDAAVPETLSSRTPRLGFVFTGQGAQWPGMGMALLEAYPVFRESIEAADAYLRDQLGCRWSAVRELRETDKTRSNIGAAEYSQPLCTVLQVALVDLLKSWNISPDAVTGHSSGEIAAAYCMGALSRESAWEVAFLRGTLATTLATSSPDLRGGMMALGLGQEAATAMITRAGVGSQACIACVNSPSSVTISGDLAGVEKLRAVAEEEGVFSRMLHVDTAYHSFHMQMVAQDYMEAIQHLTIEPAASRSRSIRMHTSVTGSLVQDPDELGAAHWVRNLVSPVLFEAAIQDVVRPRLTQDTTANKRRRDNAVDLLVEIGPHAALQGPSLQSLKAIGVTNVPYYSVLSRNLDGVETALRLAGTLFTHGVPVRFSAVNQDDDGGAAAARGRTRQLVRLPSYQWNHTQKYWAESRLARELRLRDHGARGLLGAPCPVTSTQERVWRGFLRPAEEAWVGDHKINGSILYPGAGFLAMAIEGARQLAFDQESAKPKPRALVGFRLRDVQLVAAMLVSPGQEEVEHTLALQQQHHHHHRPGDGWYHFTVASSADGQSLSTNCRGLVLVEYADDDDDDDGDATVPQSLDDVDTVNSFRAASSACNTVVDTKSFYSTLDKTGLQYGPCFANVNTLSVSPNSAVGSILVPDVGSSSSSSSSTDAPPSGPATPYRERPHIVHPTFLDAVFHLCFAALMGDGRPMTGPMVPTRIDEVSVSTSLPVASGTQLKAFCNVSAAASLKTLDASMAVMSQDESRPLLTVRGLRCSLVQGAAESQTSDSAADAAAAIDKKYASKMVWRPLVDLLSNHDLEHWLRRESSSSSSSTVNQAVANYLELLHHTNPGLSIVEMASEKEAVADNTLVASTLDPRSSAVLKTASYTVCCADDASAAHIKTALLPVDHGHLVDVVVFDLLSGAPSESPWSAAAAAVDLIIASNLSTGSKGPVKAVLQSLAKHVAASSSSSSKGRLLLLEDDARNVPLMRNVASELGLAVEADLGTTVDDGALLILGTLPPQAAAPAEQKQHVDDKQVTILTCPRASKKAAEFTGDVTAALQSLGFTSLLAAWEPSQASSLRGKTVISLLELEGPFWGDLAPAAQDGDGTEESASFSAARDLVLSAESLFWVTGFNEPAAAIVTGVARVVRNEMPGLSFRTLDVRDPLGAHSARLVSCAFASSQSTQDAEFRIQDGLVQVNRLVPDDAVNGEMNQLVNAAAAAADTATSGRRRAENLALGSLGSNSCLQLAVESTTRELDSLHFVEQDEAKPELGEDEVEISVKASHLTQTDIAAIKGDLLHHPPGASFGLEASGIVNRVGGSGRRQASKFKPGDRVVAVATGAHSTLLRASVDRVAAIPDDMSFEKAASLPLSLATAWYAVVHLARPAITSAGDRKAVILVHDPLSPVGQQVIHLARHLGLVVLATAESPSQASILADSFGIEPSNIVPLSTSVFSLAKAIRQLTPAQRGVDAAIDCSATLSGEPLRQILGCLAFFGRFVTCGAGDTDGRSSAVTASTNPNTTFSTVNITSILRTRPDVLAEILQSAFRYLNIATAARDPAPVPCFGVSSTGITAAFNHVGSSPQTTSAVLTYSEDDVVSAKLIPKSLNDSSASSSSLQLALDPDAIYVLSGGLGGLGRSLSTFLVDQLGARKLLFLSRSGAAAPSARQLLSDLETSAAQPRAAAYACDISDRRAVDASIARAEAELQGKVRGVIQCAMVLRDVLWSNMTYRDWVESTLPKIQGTENLSAAMPELDFFISLSSFAGVFGNRGQANYAAGNCFQDALAHHRRQKLGLKSGLTIDVPIMRGIGVLAETGMLDSLKDWEVPYGIGEAEFHHLMKLAIRRDMNLEPATHRHGPDHQLILGIATGASAVVAGIPTPFYLEDDAKFAIMAKMDLNRLRGHLKGAADDAADVQASIQTLLSQVANLEGASEVITQALVLRVAKMQQVDPQEVDPGRFLHTYGVDSLVAIEIVNWALKELKSKINVFDVMAGIPITVLAENIARKSELIPVDVKNG